jgi:dTDP-4-amino-4,6-dideoxygalactose transaminase
MIPFLSLADQTAAIKDDVMAALGRVIDAQGFANGPAVAAFEREFAAYLGCREVVCVNSGTAALHAALITAGVGPGDDVITVPHTWISTAWAISYLGARPVFVDVDPKTCGMSPAGLEAAMTPRVKAILPVHLYGHPVDLDPILEISARREIPVIEDAAQSIGARYKGRLTGTFGLVNATSFYPGKNLGAFGEGGAVMTDDAAIATRVRRLRDHAQADRHHHVELGFNWRMDGFQGAVLSAKLPKVEQWNARRRAIAARYLEGMAGLPSLRLPHPQAWADPNWHIFSVFHPQRDELRARLGALGVHSAVHYPRPVHLQPAYASLGYGAGSFPVAEQLAATQVSLPMFPELTDPQVEAVIDAVRAAAGEAERKVG